MENGNYDVFDMVMARDWLNAHVAALNNRKSLDIFNGQVRTTTTNDRINIDLGIDILADILGIELLEEGMNGAYTVYYFDYDGVRFFQLSEEKLVRHKEMADGAD